MKIDFGRGSYAQTESQSWNMWYFWPPYYQAYRNEPGLRIHLSAADARSPRQAVDAAVAKATGALAPVLGAFAGVLPMLAGHLMKNPSGGIDIRMSEHGFQVNSAPAGDPSVWINGAWRPVALALSKLGALAGQPPALPVPLLGDIAQTAETPSSRLAVTEGALATVAALEIPEEA